MNLRDFVSEALTSISEGVSDAISKRVEDGGGGAINPAWSTSIGPDYKEREIEFDVAVTSEETGSRGGKADIKVISADLSKQSKSSMASRIKFAVPIIFPATAIERADDLKPRT